MKKIQVNLTIEINKKDLVKSMGIQGEEFCIEDECWWKDQFYDILECCESTKILINLIKTLDK